MEITEKSQEKKLNKSLEITGESQKSMVKINSTLVRFFLSDLPLAHKGQLIAIVSLISDLSNG